jgi:hypothetical protein
VIVQIFIPDHVLRNISSRTRTFPSPVAFGTPRIKFIVVCVQILHIGIQLIDPREHRVVVRSHRIRRSSSGDLPFAVANSDGRGIASFINVDAIRARPCNGKRQIGSINFVGLVVIQMTHAHQNRAFRQSHLRDVIVQI